MSEEVESFTVPYTVILDNMIKQMKETGYTYKDGKIYDKKGKCASYPDPAFATDALYFIVWYNNQGARFRAPLEHVVLRWHGKPIKEDELPIPSDGDITNTRVENLVYLEDGEKIPEPKFEKVRSKNDLGVILFSLDILPDLDSANDVNPAELLSDIALQHKNRADVPITGASFALYQDFVESRMNKKLTAEQSLLNYTLGIAGEAGEVADIIKKHFFHGHTLNVADVVDELGDVLFYVQALCNVLGVDMSQLILTNARKLSVRYPNGFDPEKSKNREDVKDGVEEHQ